MGVGMGVVEYSSSKIRDINSLFAYLWMKTYAEMENNCPIQYIFDIFAKKSLKYLL